MATGVFPSWSSSPPYWFSAEFSCFMTFTMYFSTEMYEVWLKYMKFKFVKITLKDTLLIIPFKILPPLWPHSSCHSCHYLQQFWTPSSCKFFWGVIKKPNDCCCWEPSCRQGRLKHQCGSSLISSGMVELMASSNSEWRYRGTLLISHGQPWCQNSRCKRILELLQRVARTMEWVCSK